MAYSKELSRQYADKRSRFKSSDHALLPILKKVGIKGKVVLDFGCGDGAECPMLLGMGAKRIIGVDPSREMIDLAKRRKLPRAKFFTALSVKPGEVDVIFSRFVFHYIKDLDQQFVKLAKALKKGGAMVAIFQCLAPNAKNVNILVPLTLGKAPHEVRIKIFSKDIRSVRKGLLDADFRIAKLAKVKNTDSKIEPDFKGKNRFVNSTYILYAVRN